MMGLAIVYSAIVGADKYPKTMAWIDLVVFAAVLLPLANAFCNISSESVSATVSPAGLQVRGCSLVQPSDC
jgi:hypothetical protein